MQRSLTDILRAVGDVAEFSDIPVTDANTLGLFKNRPLHIAAVWGDCEAIEILVRAGASIDQRGEDGFTPLMEATAHGNLAACRLLAALGARPLPNDDGQSPSEYAAAGDQRELSDWLRTQGL